ncbi:MAG: hypothetical protein ACI8RP_001805 [Urechidicola sp.]
MKKELNINKGNLIKYTFVILLIIVLFIQIKSGILEGKEVRIFFWIIINVLPFSILLNLTEKQKSKISYLSITMNIYLALLLLIVFSRLFPSEIFNIKGYGQLFFQSYFILIPFQILIWFFYIKSNYLLFFKNSSSNKTESKSLGFVKVESETEDVVKHEDSIMAIPILLSNDEIKSIEDFVKENKLKEAIEKLLLKIPLENQKQRKEVMLIERSYTQIKHDNSIQIISYQEFNIGISRISSSLLDFISNFNQGA